MCNGDERILVHSASPLEAARTSRILREAGFESHVCSDVHALCVEIHESAACAVLSREIAADRFTALTLSKALRNQPPWSDFPLLLPANDTCESAFTQELIETFGNVTLLDAPVRVNDLVSAVRTALRSRRKQYQIKEHLALRERAEQEAREYQIKLESALKDAEAASSAKDTFLAVLSHELRTPLTPVLTAVEALRRDKGFPFQFRPLVEMIRRNVALETRLIDDLLDLTHIVHNKIDLDRKVIDIHKILRHSIETCESDLRNKGLSLFTGFQAHHYHLSGDETRLQQVFWNVLKNAIKFTPAGGSISVITESDAERLVIRVRDSGVGIDPRLMPRVFTAFEQGEGSERRTLGGLGLGLAITRALVELHGGKIEAESAGVGSGATFSMYFDCCEPVEVRDPQRLPRMAERFNALSVLLVEDHTDTSMMLKILLERIGCRVRVADTVSSALRALRSEEFELLLSDIGLPDGSGLDLMLQIQDSRSIPGIVMSGFGMPEDLRRSREAGFLEHLIKPVDFDTLRAAITRVLRKAPPDSELQPEI